MLRKESLYRASAVAGKPSKIPASCAQACPCSICNAQLMLSTGVELRHLQGILDVGKLTAETPTWYCWGERHQY
jgi:ferredoxin